MKMQAIFAAAALTLMGSVAANAQDHAAAKALATKSACMACHAVDKKMVGPAYKDVAAKYKGMDAAKLAASIKAGGSGKWGAVPMPAQAALKDDDAKLLAQWVLAGAPDK
ncbi:MAG: Cytochrome c-551 precursor [Pseudomonadota bacterium]|jgi:cytochrome c